MKQVFALSSKLPRFADPSVHSGVVTRFLYGGQPEKSGLVRECVVVVAGLTGPLIAKEVRKVVENSGILTEVGQPLYSVDYDRMLKDATAERDLQLPCEVFLRQDVVLSVSRHGVNNVEIVLWRLYPQCAASADNLLDRATPVLGKRNSERKGSI
jgi:hypothetical protein